jgi:hypothetical protein
MVLVEAEMLLLPVHCRTREIYLADRRAFETKQKAALARNWGTPLDKLHVGLRAYFQDSWLCTWPPWLLNDLVGWAVIGFDGQGSLCGDLWCRRKNLPKGRPERNCFGFTTLERNQWLHWLELYREPVRYADNADCTRSVLRLIKAARQEFRKRWRKAEVWLPPFGLDCINWVEAIRQAKERAGKQRGARDG